MIQITITAEQVKTLGEWARTLLIPLVGWFIRRTIIRTKATLNEIITDNANRIKNELQTHIDVAFVAHEDSAFARITALEKSVNEIGRILQEIKQSKVN